VVGDRRSRIEEALAAIGSNAFDITGIDGLYSQ